MCDGLVPHKKVYPNIGLFWIPNRGGLVPHNNVSTGDEQFYIGWFPKFENPMKLSERLSGFVVSISNTCLLQLAQSVVSFVAYNLSQLVFQFTALVTLLKSVVVFMASCRVSRESPQMSRSEQPIRMFLAKPIPTRAAQQSTSARYSVYARPGLLDMAKI